VNRLLKTEPLVIIKAQPAGQGKPFPQG